MLNPAHYRVCLPRSVRPDRSHVGDPPPQAYPLAGSTRVAELRCMTTTEPPLRLAVVDDHPLIRQGFAAIANTWPKGRVVLMATDGLDYERQVAELGHIHIALVDLCMPRRDGYETLRWRCV